MKDEKHTEQHNENLTGTLALVMALGAFILATWFWAFGGFLDRF